MPKRDAQPGIFGAGAVGGFVGGAIAASGRHPVLVGRASLCAQVQSQGLTITTAQSQRAVASTDLVCASDAVALADCDPVFVAVKSRDTVAAGQSLGPVLAPGTTVVSLQNGVRNTTRLSQALPHCAVFASVVGFNVIRDESSFRQTTAGHVLIDAEARKAIKALAGTLVSVRETTEMEALQWGKLVVNLNNAVNALSGLPLAAQLEDPDYRAVSCAAMAEAVKVLRRADKGLRSPQPLSLEMLIRLLSLPNALFVPVARLLLRPDPKARSSMADDLQAGKPTEIEELQGEIVGLANHYGLEAPVNEALLTLVRAASERKTARMNAAELRRATSV